MSPLPGADGSVGRIVTLARRHLGMDVAFVSQVTLGRQVYRAVSGEGGPFGVRAGAAALLDSTLCSRMLVGDLPNLLRDVARDSRVLIESARERVGAYLGVPLHLPDGRLYGTLCCLSLEPRPELEARDVGFLSLLAEYLGDELDGYEVDDASRTALADVLHREAVELALQPVVSLQTGEVTALEALARFPAGIGSPDAAFATAAHVGMRAELELLAVRKALEVQRELPLPVAVNVSPDVACDLVAGLPDDLAVDRLVLELTEHQEVVSYARVRELLEPLRRRGLRLAIDDTGAGFASLRHVVELKPDVIKIDRSLVAGIDADRARRSVVTTFVLMALDIGAWVVAEGVETGAELTTLSSLGVDEAQGFLLARPSTDRADWERWASPGARLIGGTSGRARGLTAS